MEQKDSSGWRVEGFLEVSAFASKKK